jgi:hypothetical protein
LLNHLSPRSARAGWQFKIAKRPKRRVKAKTGILRFHFWCVVFLWFVLGANSRRSTYNGTIRLSLSREKEYQHSGHTHQSRSQPNLERRNLTTP